jgi:hypothetical protein
VKNKYEIRGEVTAIFLKSPKYGAMETLISTTKLDMVKEFPNTWRPIYDKSTGLFYVRGSLNRKSLAIHRLITNAPFGMQVDHINHDTLNNTDQNIRVITQAQNLQNQRGSQKNSKSGVRGVNWHKHMKKWVAKVKVNRKFVYLGYYHDIEEAERVVKEARARLMPYSNEAS